MKVSPKRVLLLGATGTIGRAVLAALLRHGHAVVCVVRQRPGIGSRMPTGAELRFGDVEDAHSLATEVFRGDRFDTIVSCMASRTGTPKDAWAVDYRAHKNLLEAARGASVTHFVLLSAICVQKPLLAFQQAKLAFEKLLMESGMSYSIVRATAFFKSLSGQVERVKNGKPFLVFGNGELTACKPISDADLAEFITACLDDESRRDRVLIIGGPGNPITPRQQGEHLFALLGRTPRFRHIPIGVLDAIIRVLSSLGRVFPALADKAELARIGRYYATESMLTFDGGTGRYDAAATPSTGTDTLFDYYSDLVHGRTALERGDHAVF